MKTMTLAGTSVRLLAIALAVFAYAPAQLCAAGVAVGGETIADARLQHDVIANPGFTVMLTRAGGCATVDSIVAKLIQPPKDRTASPTGKLLKGEWHERWDVTACGKPIAIFMTFTSDGVGGTDFGIGTH